MLCLRYRRLLVPYMECELDERVRAKVERHVSHCARCAAELALIRSVSGAIKSAQMPAMEPAPDLWARVSARIEREATRPASRPWIRVTQAASACAAAVFVAVVGISLMHTTPPRQGVPPPPPKNEEPAVESPVAGSTGAETSGPAVAGVPRSSRAAPLDGTRVAVGEPAAPARRVRAYEAKRPAAGTRYAAAPPADSYDKKDADRLAGVAELPAASSTNEEAVGERLEAGTTVAKGPGVGGTALHLSGLDAPDRARSEVRHDVTPAEVALAPAPGRSVEFGMRPAEKPTFGDSSSIARSSPASTADGSYKRYSRFEEAGAKTGHFYADMGHTARALTAAAGGKGESVVDALNETEGVRIAALFSYP